MSGNKPQTIHDMANHIFNEAIKHANADRFDEAVGVYGNIIDLKSALTNAFQQRGRCHWEMNRWTEARKDFEDALRMEPDNHDFAWTLGLMQLQQHNYADGWKGYARRWGSKHFKSPRLRTNKPEWHPGCGAKKILVWPEQGLGDQIIYSSMLPLLAQHGEVTAMVDMRLANLLNRAAKPGLKFVPHDARISLKDHDAHLPLGSLGQYFIENINDIYKTESNYISQDPDRTQQLKNKYHLGDKVIGLSWQSTAPTVGKHKSCTLKDWEPILKWGEEKGFQFLSLQYGDLSELEKYPQIIKPSEHLYFDLESACALMACCERIISVSNVNVHLAGAMGINVNMLDANKLWYWGAKDEANHSMWYPSVKIHPRKNMLAPWDKPVDDVLRSLKEYYA